MELKILGLISSLAALSFAAPYPDDGSQKALSFAYMYGFPLYAYGDVAKSLLAKGIPLRPNIIIASSEPNEPGAVGVVRLNTDTIYSIMFIDLSLQDLRVTIFEIPGDRYWIFPFCIPYGDNLVNLGNLGVSEPGDYLLKYNPNEYGLETNKVPEGYVGVINFPMAYGLVNSRIVTDRSEEDVAIIAELQKGFCMEEVPRAEKPIAPALDFTMSNQPEYSDQNQSYYKVVMNTAAALTPYNPPYVVSDRKKVASELQKAGFNEGKFCQPPQTNLTAAVESANTTSTLFAAKPGVRQDIGNDWYIVAEEYIGRFESFYAMRYQIGLTAYLALVQSESACPFYGKDLSVEEGQSVLSTFTKPPKIRDGGFWSLTAYGPDQDLIENDLEKYMVGDRSNLTFPDGSPVQEGDDRPFQVLLQAEDIVLPSNWTNNWLPINSGDGNVPVTLRWYGAEEMVDGTHVHPKIEFIDAIKA
ncbi:hypothetical protein ACHAP5_005531 [Fusarium lateritium]